MPEKTKAKKDNSNKPKTKAEKPRGEQTEVVDKDVWSEDQQSKSYYYDDSYGYEIYNSDEDDDDDE